MVATKWAKKLEEENYNRYVENMLAKGNPAWIHDFGENNQM
jgi:hypothetical protein